MPASVAINCCRCPHFALRLLQGLRTSLIIESVWWLRLAVRCWKEGLSQSQPELGAWASTLVGLLPNAATAFLTGSSHSVSERSAHLCHCWLSSLIECSKGEASDWECHVQGVGKEGGQPQSLGRIGWGHFELNLSDALSEI